MNQCEEHHRSSRSSANRGGVDLHNRTIQAHIHAAARVRNVPGEAETRRKDKSRCFARRAWIMEESLRLVFCRSGIKNDE